MEQGELALKPGGRRCFAVISTRRNATGRTFVDDWYLTGDLAMRDAGRLFLVRRPGGRRHKSAGHLIGPFEVESTMIEHAAVSEAAVIGVPDPVAARP